MMTLTDAQILALSKGARLAVLLLLSNHPEGLTQGKLGILTGAHHVTLASALAYLAEMRLVGQSMASDGSKRWFTTEGLGVSVSDTLSHTDTPIIIKLINTESIDSKTKTIGVSHCDTPSQPSDALPEYGGKSAEEVRAIFAELGKLSILRNDRTQALVAMPHMTLAYVRAKAAEIRAQKRAGSHFAGLNLQVFEQNQPLQVEEEPASVQDQVSQFLGRSMSDDDDQESE